MTRWAWYTHRGFTCNWSGNQHAQQEPTFVVYPTSFMLTQKHLRCTFVLRRDLHTHKTCRSMRSPHWMLQSRPAYSLSWTTKRWEIDFKRVIDDIICCISQLACSLGSFGCCPLNIEAGAIKLWLQRGAKNVPQTCLHCRSCFDTLSVAAAAAVNWAWACNYDCHSASEHDHSFGRPLKCKHPNSFRDVEQCKETQTSSNLVQGWLLNWLPKRHQVRYLSLT